jgi:hypothetical protein
VRYFEKYLILLSAVIHVTHSFKLQKEKHSAQNSLLSCSRIIPPGIKVQAIEENESHNIKTSLQFE